MLCLPMIYQGSASASEVLDLLGLLRLDTLEVCQSRAKTQ